MGEAKRKGQLLVKAAIERLDRWCFPASAEEAAVVGEIASLPCLEAHRLRRELLMGMKPNLCHENSWKFAEEMPLGKCKQVTGWWPCDGDYVLHSVIELRSDLYCVTPSQGTGSPVFPFIPDPQITWRQEGDHRYAYRGDYKIGLGVRSDPAKTIRRAAVVRNRILAGADPTSAAAGVE